MEYVYYRMHQAFRPNSSWGLFHFRFNLEPVPTLYMTVLYR
jgi:hypothetical protein